MFDVEYDEKEGMIAIDGQLYSVEEAEMRPSEKACRYCRAQSSCPAVKLALVNVTAGDLAAAWESWPLEKRREAYDLAKLAKRWAASVEAKVKADLRAEVEIPGLVMAPGRRAFTVTKPAEAFRILNELYPESVTAEAFTACCKVGITDLDKLVHGARKKEDGGSKVSDSKDWLRKTLAGCAEVKVSEGSVKEVEGGGGMMTTLTITLPHTPRCLSPNAKAPLTQRGAQVAGFKKTVAKSRARNIAWGLTCEALNGRRMLPTHYRVIWFFKGPRPDADNCLARCKAYLDGACKAMGIDDRTLDCTGIYRIHDLAKAGQVEIVFERRSA